jgi:glycosyltransferase involved in cell wall biosynthesis
MRYLFSLSLKRSEMVIVPSNVMYQICLGWKIDPLKIKVIFNSVDGQKFYPTKNQIKKFDVVTVSRLIDIKQIEGVIKAASKLNLKLLIVGSGPEEQALRNLNQNLGNPATFFGNAAQEQLPDLYRLARFFVLNSEFEAGTPYALLEARASGLVCIANERTGAADVITHNQDGFLCGPINKSDLLLNLRRATELGDKYSTFSEMARKSTLENFSETSIYSAIISNCERR